MEKMEQTLRTNGLLKGDSLYDVENVSTVHHVNQALRAHKLFQRDKDYIVRNGEVVIIDEFTGRMTPLGRLADPEQFADMRSIILVSVGWLSSTASASSPIEWPLPSDSTFRIRHCSTGTPSLLNRSSSCRLISRLACASR